MCARSLSSKKNKNTSQEIFLTRGSIFPGRRRFGLSERKSRLDIHSGSLCAAVAILEPSSLAHTFFLILMSSLNPCKDSRKAHRPMVDPMLFRDKSNSCVSRNSEYREHNRGILFSQASFRKKLDIAIAISMSTNHLPNLYFSRKIYIDKSEVVNCDKHERNYFCSALYIISVCICSQVYLFYQALLSRPTNVDIVKQLVAFSETCAN